MQSGQCRRPPEVLREVGGLGEALEEVVEEVVEVVEALGCMQEVPEGILGQFQVWGMPCG
jgi:hypothetical protein